MTDPQPSFLSTITDLNETSEGELATAYLQGTDPQYLQAGQRLATAGLLEWALDNLAANPGWAEAVRQAAHLAEDDDPEALQAAIVPTGFLQTQTRSEAGTLMLRWVVDLIPPGTNPA